MSTNSTPAPQSAPAAASSRVHLALADKIRVALTEDSRTGRVTTSGRSPDYLSGAPKSRINAVIARVLAEGVK
jgi:hypothetical protein